MRFWGGARCAAAQSHMRMEEEKDRTDWQTDRPARSAPAKTRRASAWDWTATAPRHARPLRPLLEGNAAGGRAGGQRPEPKKPEAQPHTPTFSHAPLDSYRPPRARRWSCAPGQPITREQAAGKPVGCSPPTRGTSKNNAVLAGCCVARRICTAHRCVAGALTIRKNATDPMAVHDCMRKAARANVRWKGWGTPLAYNEEWTGRPCARPCTERYAKLAAASSGRLAVAALRKMPSEMLQVRNDRLPSKSKPGGLSMENAGTRACLNMPDCRWLRRRRTLEGLQTSCLSCALSSPCRWSASINDGTKMVTANRRLRPTSAVMALCLNCRQPSHGWTGKGHQFSLR